VTERSAREIADAMERGVEEAARFEITYDAKKNLVLPELPDANDRAALCQWLTASFNCDPRHPITEVEWQGPRGPEGHVVLRRRGARHIRFEPARQINQPMRLIEALSWYRIPSDWPVPGLRATHCSKIAYVIAVLADNTGAADEGEETLGIVSAFMQDAVAVEGHTSYGTSGQRYEAARALQRDTDSSGRATSPPRYLIDAGKPDPDTGELPDEGEIVIRVSDLKAEARVHVGSTRHGWLDARMNGIGWKRVRLDGYGLPGRAGRRQGPHARCDVYRGSLPAPEDESEDGSVNT
jgi:hypothetical protein